MGEAALIGADWGTSSLRAYLIAADGEQHAAGWLRTLSATGQFVYSGCYGARLLPGAEAWKTTGIVIANASCNFRRAMTYPGTVEVKVFVARPGRSSVATYYDLSIESEIYADGAAVVVFIDMATQKPLPIPEEIRSSLP